TIVRIHEWGRRQYLGRVLVVAAFVAKFDFAIAADRHKRVGILNHKSGQMLAENARCFLDPIAHRLRVSRRSGPDAWRRYLGIVQLFRTSDPTVGKPLGIAHVGLNGSALQFVASVKEP